MTVCKGRTERDTACPFPDSQAAQQEHNARVAELLRLSPELLELVRAWGRISEPLRTAILAIVKSAS
jgi:hypothetical protein